MSDTAFSDASDVITSNGGGGGGGAGGGDVAVYINGDDVTACCLSGSWTRRLNRPAQAEVRVPMDCAVYNVGDRLRIDALVGTTWEIMFHGMILLAETDTGEDFGYTVYNASDPMELWSFRPVRDDTGDFSNPTLIQDYVTGPQIVEDMLQNTEGDSTAQGNPALTPPTDAEGPTFLDFGSFEMGGVDLSGAPTDWPMQMSELASLLCSTGCVDLIITPTDPGGGIMGTIDGYNGDYGTDLSGSVVFEYGTGAHNIARVRWNEDMSNMTNKLWYFMGPRIETPADPGALQHWCYNVQGDDTGLPATFPNGTDRDTWLAGARMDSRTDYGVRMDIQIFDAGDCALASGSECCDTDSGYRELYRNRWETESYIRAQPRQLMHITPIRGTEIGTFDIGDLVGVTCTAAVRGGFSGAQRVYEYTVSWDEDGVLALSELQTSDTADAA